MRLAWGIKLNASRIVLIGILAASSAAQAADDRFGVDDLTRLAAVAEPTLSPDGRLVAYSVETANAEADKQHRKG